MEDLTCMDKDGNISQFQFAYSNMIVNSEVEHEFLIYTIPIDKNKFYELVVSETMDNMLIVSQIRNNSFVEFRGKGIFEAILNIMKIKFNRPIYSSTNIDAKKKLSKEFRTDSATKLWEKLVSREKATKDNNLDRYIFL